MRYGDESLVTQGTPAEISGGDGMMTPAYYIDPNAPQSGVSVNGSTPEDYFAESDANTAARAALEMKMPNMPINWKAILVGAGSGTLVAPGIGTIAGGIAAYLATKPPPVIRTAPTQVAPSTSTPATPDVISQLATAAGVSPSLTPLIPADVSPIAQAVVDLTQVRPSQPIQRVLPIARPPIDLAVEPTQLQGYRNRRR